MVQPYILGIKSQLGSSLLKLFVVLDDSLLELGKVPMVRALDWLMQTYIVFNLKYPFGWRNTLHLLQTAFMNVFSSKGDMTTPSAQELLTILR